jgi:hypothetical protein
MSYQKVTMSGKDAKVLNQFVQLLIYGNSGRMLESAGPRVPLKGDPGRAV